MVSLGSSRSLFSVPAGWLFIFVSKAVNVLFEYLPQYTALQYLEQSSSPQTVGDQPLHVLFQRPTMELKGRVVIYSILGCPHCMRAKNSLQELGIPYTDVSLDKYPHARQELQIRTNKRTVPQIFFNARHIGGNEELQELVRLTFFVIVIALDKYRICY